MKSISNSCKPSCWRADDIPKRALNYFAPSHALADLRVKKGWEHNLTMFIRLLAFESSHVRCQSKQLCMATFKNVHICPARSWQQTSGNHCSQTNTNKYYLGLAFPNARKRSSSPTQYVVFKEKCWSTCPNDLIEKKSSGPIDRRKEHKTKICLMIPMRTRKHKRKQTATVFSSSDPQTKIIFRSGRKCILFVRAGNF